MWLDSLILRLMDSAQKESSRVWFIIDELSSLQRLPQLPTAITEGRKSNICLVIGFQGRSQLETLYGHQAEAMLSQPMTKVFLRTSEPNAAEWVSRSIGEVEVMRLEETHSQTVPSFLGNRGKSSRMQRHTEPLVMASTIEGLHNLTGYIKSRDLVVAASFSYLKLKTKHPAFVPRALPELEPLTLPKSEAGAVTSADKLKAAQARKKIGNPESGIDKCVTYQDHVQCLSAITVKIIKRLKTVDRRKALVETYKYVTKELGLQSSNKND